MKRTFEPQQLTGDNNPLPRFPQLYEAALDEFSEKSWAQASLNDILKRAGMSKGSLYHHFGDKFGLYLALMDMIAKKKSEFFLPRLQGLSPGGDFFQAVKLLSREMMAFMFQDKRMYNLTSRLLSEEPELIKRLTACFPGEKNRMLEALADSAVAAGQIDARFTPEFVRRMLDILFSNLHLLPGISGTQDTFGQLELALDMMQYGLCGPRGENGGSLSPLPPETLSTQKEQNIP